MAIKKGQNLRLFIQTDGGELKCIAAATDCSYNIDAQLEEITSKDSTNDWQEQDCTGKSWGCSANALVVIDDAETALTAFDLANMVGTKVTAKLQETNGEKNRSAVSGGKTLTGTGIISAWSLQSNNRANATYSVNIAGSGPLA